MNEEKMKKKDRLFDSILSEIAVERGLKLPESKEEVRLFESTNSNLQASNIVIPELKQTLERAKKARSKGLEARSSHSHLDDQYAMAARNGAEIEEDLLEKLNKGSDSIREKRDGSG